MPRFFSRKPWPFRRYQVALVLLSVLPLVVVFGVLAWWKGQELRDSVNQGMLRTAEALSLAVDREIGIVLAALETLADSEAVDRGDIEALTREAQRAAQRRRDSWIVISDRSGQQLINTSLPAGQPLPKRTPGEDDTKVLENGLPLGSVSFIQKVFATGQSSNSNLFVSIAHKRPVVAIAVPVARQGDVRYVLSSTFPPQRLTDLVASQAHEQRTTIVDANGFVVARSDQPELVGTRIGPQYGLPSGATPMRGVVSATSLSGQPVYRAFARSLVTGWTVSIATLQADADWQVATGVLRTIGVGAAGAIMSILLALWHADRVRSPITTLAAKATGKTHAALPRRFVAAEFIDLQRAIDEGNRAREAERLEREARFAAEARKAEADSANRAKDQFLAMLAHELRNPLAAITNAISVMEMAPHQTSSMTPILRRQSEHLKKMVDDLLDVARVTMGKMRLMLEPVDLYELAAHCIDTFAQTDRTDSHELRLVGQSVTVYADKHRMLQVVTNLLDNALKFSPTGTRVTVAVTSEDDDAVLQVADEGAGISAEALPHIFDVFVQGVEPADAGRSGLGLGLALAKSLVLAQQGRISAASDGPGKGAVFTVRMARAMSPESS